MVFIYHTLYLLWLLLYNLNHFFLYCQFYRLFLLLITQVMLILLYRDGRHVTYLLHHYRRVHLSHQSRLNALNLLHLIQSILDFIQEIVLDVILAAVIEFDALLIHLHHLIHSVHCALFIQSLLQGR